MALRPMKLVLVQWIDPHGNWDWKPLREIEGNSPTTHCKSVGWVLCENNESITLVPHISGYTDAAHTQNGFGDLIIPKAAIIRKTVISEEPAKEQ